MCACERVRPMTLDDNMWRRREQPKKDGVVLRTLESGV